MNGRGKDCLIPSRLPQISCFPLSLKCFSSDSDNCPDVGIGALLQFLHPLRAGPVLLTPVFHASSHVLPSFAWFYIFFPAVRHSCPLSASVLHAILSERIVLMYSWREMYYTSTYSSTILFLSPLPF